MLCTPNICFQGAQENNAPAPPGELAPPGDPAPPGDDDDCRPPGLQSLCLNISHSSYFFQARINLRCFGNLGKAQSGHSDKKYAMGRAKTYSDQWTRSIRPPQAKSVWCSEALWQVYKIYKLCCHGPGIESVVTNRLSIATVAHNIFWIDMQNISFGLKCRITRRATCPHLFLALKYNWVFNIFCVLNIFDVALFVFTLAVGTFEEMVNTWLWQSSFSSGWKGELDHNDPWIKGMLVILVLITLNMFSP